MTATIAKSKTVIELKNTLADTYALLLKTHNYHWNITGANFYSLHKLFEEQYNELFAAADEIAERIRALGSKAPGSFSEFAKLTSITEANNNASASEILNDLVQSNQAAVDSLTTLKDTAESEEDKETEDLAISRIQIHQKNIWMLKASI